MSPLPAKRSGKINWASVQAALKPYIAQSAKFRRRYYEMPKKFPALKQAALAAVKRWDCYSYPGLELDPAFHFTARINPGRLLKKDPGPDDPRVERYGFDADGRMVAHTRKGESGEETYWEHNGDGIQGMTARLGAKASAASFRIHCESLFFKQGRPLWFFHAAKGFEEVKRFEFAGDRIVKILAAARDLTNEYGGTKRWVYRVAEIHYPSAGSAIATVTFDSGFVEKIRSKVPNAISQPAANIKPPVLDLRKDVAEAARFFAQAVTQFCQRQQGKRSPGEVSAIGVQFQHYGNGAMPEILVSFDTREDFEDDGEWSHQFVASLKRPAWRKFEEACEDAEGRGIIVDARGKEHKVGPETESVQWFGQMLGEALLETTRQQAFKALQKTGRCKLLVHDIDFAFHWLRPAK